ncbi:hypothetical protein PBCV1_a690gR [Paramecium bursaria Chlorella virus 1]|uniref:Uncharacterized protein n=1 Tax=Paramecium bursaria Chlorella virus 1 TaxID=10506 RepID=F8TU95_PBCV1|nr:hypothetical protein PBCV1_a002aR [Paramecium bursaria Chlorella virus 1]YP_004679011.1 hypothetical protein PBCV1_a690gR [Paramecium bursaria Chlorella virus 1]AEI70015.1 hypothetical protein [Paramecium bursaria Chlorella virus 1]AEI70156.1 hypothetical protein [Paramecium bursaria Chlorella virus 1]
MNSHIYTRGGCVSHNFSGNLKDIGQNTQWCRYAEIISYRQTSSLVINLTKL